MDEEKETVGDHAGSILYGASDDLIEIEGEISGEVSFLSTADDDEDGDQALIVMSDGTVATVRYGKGALGIWSIQVIREGDLFDRLEVCDDEDADRYSDQLFMKPGLEWAVASAEWEKMQ